MQGNKLQEVALLSRSSSQVSGHGHAFRNWEILEVAHDCRTSSRRLTGNSTKVATNGKVLVRALRPQRSKQPIRQVNKFNNLKHGIAQVAAR